MRRVWFVNGTAWAKNPIMVDSSFTHPATFAVEHTDLMLL
jgi:hypothetical protein